MNPVYTLEQLEALKRPQLWEICSRLALPKYPASRTCIEAIMSKQPIKIDEQAVVQAELEVYLEEQVLLTTETAANQDQVETVLEQTEVDEIPDQDFGSLCRLWHQTTLLGTFYRKIFSDEWIATPAGSVEPYHCPNEDDAKYWLVADYLKVASPQLPTPDSQLPITKNWMSKSLMLASSCFLLLVAHKPDIEEIYQPIDNGSQLASSEAVDCSYRGGSRREDCLQVP
jgi:hypothetical protein